MVGGLGIEQAGKINDGWLMPAGDRVGSTL
jgi:hypothetical protein